MSLSIRSSIDIMIFSLLSSIFFCIMCSVVDNFLGFWVFLELGGLSLIPSFFYNSSSSLYNFYGALLMYVIMSGLSSVVLVSGILFSELYIFIFLGFVIKLGLFPFSFWVYWVLSSSNWFFIFLLSVIMKFPVLFFCYLYSNYSVSVVYMDCSLTVLFCSFMLWIMSFSWEYIWCHISLSSVSTLVASCFCSDVTVCYFIYFYYFFWAISCIILFNSFGDEDSATKSKFWLFCFLLLVTPVSMPLLYKISVCYGILGSSLFLLICWSIYSFSEQLFLYKVASIYLYDMVFNSWSK